jgi:hypothetical protein
VIWRIGFVATKMTWGNKRKKLRSELARLKQIMGTVKEALRGIDTYSYKGGMTSDAEKKAHAQLAEFMTKSFRNFFRPALGSRPYR